MGKTMTAEERFDKMFAQNKPFKDHILEEKHNDGLYRHWRCGKPGRSEYYFNVITWPGWIVITGDVGELMVSRVQDMLSFVRGSVNSTSYFAEKVPKSIETKEFSRERAMMMIEERIKQMIEDGGCSETTIDELRDIKARVDSGDLGDDELYGEWLRLLPNDDVPCFTDWNSNFLWCRECLRWFIERLDAEANQQAAAIAEIEKLGDMRQPV